MGKGTQVMEPIATHVLVAQLRPERRIAFGRSIPRQVKHVAQRLGDGVELLG